MAELSDKHKLFIAEYVANNCNATKAYQAVYDCDYDTAMSNGHRLLRNAEIKAEVNKQINAILDDKEALALQVVNEYKKIAFSDISKFVDPVTGEPTATDETDTTVLKSIEFKHGEKTSSIKYKLHSKISALDALSKYVVGFTEKKEILIPDIAGIVDELKNAFESVKNDGNS